MSKSGSRIIELSSVLMLCSLAQFVVCFRIAIVLYPVDYHLSTDYISELGCVKDGFATHAWIFNVSLAVFAIGLCWFFGVLVYQTFEGPVELLVIGGCGFASSFSVFFIAAFPWKVFPGPHTLAMCSWLFWLLPAISVWMEWGYSDTSRRSPRNFSYAAMGKSLCALVILFPMASMVGAGPALQKVVVLLCLLWLVVFAIHLRSAFRRGLVKPGFAGRKRKETPIEYLKPGTYDGRSTDRS